MTDAPLKLFNSLTRELEPFTPIHDGEARVYTCGPTVYNYQHIGNMRAYIFADTLGRTLSWKGYSLSHVINITDVGHLTSDADAGDDKMEKAAAAQGKSAWDIARYYQEVFEADLDRLNVRKPAHPRATDYVESMIEWGKQMQDKHCYELDSGLYFAADFAIWRKTPEGEDRQMEWDSPWGKGAPGWHLECSVMSAELLGHPFDIHTGGIDHREIHHPNEIAQNQAHNCSEGSAANIWMHNNFLIDRRGKMSKSSGEFLVLQTLVDRGYHPLAYRMLCLQAHYRSELEFSWEGLSAALTRLKRMVMLAERLADTPAAGSTDHPKFAPTLEKFGAAMTDDLNTAIAVTALEDALSTKKVDAAIKRAVVEHMDAVLGLGLFDLARTDLRIRPKSAEISEDEIEAALVGRKAARAEKDFAKSDAIRDDLMAKGVEVMDGDPLGWEWKLS